MLNDAAERWAKARTFHHSLYPAARIADEREQSVSVCVRTRERGAAVGEIVGALERLRSGGAVDEIVVVDASPADGTAEAAMRAGANVVREHELTGEMGPVLGKGDTMWRVLPLLSGELVVFLDTDGDGFSERLVTGLLGPLVCVQGVQFTKAFHRPSLRREGIQLPETGRRVNHLMARPALAAFYPELAGVRHPLAGEVGASRALLERVPFATGHEVDMALLIDVWREVGLEGMAQVDVDVRPDLRRPPSAPEETSDAVLATIVRRLAADGRLSMYGIGDRSRAGSVVDAGYEAPLEHPPVASELSR